MYGHANNIVARNFEGNTLSLKPAKKLDKIFREKTPMLLNTEPTLSDGDMHLVKDNDCFVGASQEESVEPRLSFEAIDGEDLAFKDRPIVQLSS